MKKISGEICGARQIVDLVNYFKIVWFSLIVSLLVLVLPSPDYLQAETVSRKGIVFYDDAEDAPDFSREWRTNGVGGPNTLTSSSEKARAGSRSFKVVLAPSGTSGAQTNCELVLAGLDSPVKINNFVFGREYWMGWSVYLPTTFKAPISNTGEWRLHGQFHASPDACDNIFLNPTGALQFTKTSDGALAGITTSILAEWPECSDKNYERAKGYTTSENWEYGWNDVVINFKFHYDATSNPFYKVYLNGKLVINDTGPNCWNDSRGPYFKWGLYANHPDWGIIYMDEFRVGDATSDYASVAPGNSSTPPPTAPRGLTVK